MSLKRFFQPIQKDGSSKKPALSTNSYDDDGGTQSETNEPLKFMTWNANSLLLRAKNNWPEFSKLVTSFDPDIIAIQEVRMPAAGSKGAPKNQGELKDDTNASREEKQVVMRALSSPPFGNYRVWWSLADSKYAGTALLVKKCFKPKKISFSLDTAVKKHEPDGRLILAEFDSLRFLNTYVPNNGWKEEESSFVRRRKWDKKMLELVLQLSDKPLIWSGDLNVSHEDIDVSHPEFFASAKMNGYIPPNKEDCGQPGFTISERKRFGAIMKEGNLIDAYRFLHTEKDMECGFSWSGNPVGKYRGKRMRIDYFLVSEKLKDRIVSCKMHGHGIELEGFCGSDHCPVSLELAPSSTSPNLDEAPN
ncbi:DNA-(apurinic or apyrimidinic site) endonuclease isoform X1 [Amaranthus tricolor]|uniref:DNA-(apurinic or apyrimidinic site) endonuclease isoform X1 n=1 Tax=Amaranthus tricolor TaxID=29722 RepID=UPI002586AFDF|nr:DNA-(apurinic or apyrimidinic site) endonuclease isoform X1 [Amaranthus tricolor]